VSGAGVTGAASTTDAASQKATGHSHDHDHGHTCGAGCTHDHPPKKVAPASGKDKKATAAKDGGHVCGRGCNHDHDHASVKKRKPSAGKPQGGDHVCGSGCDHDHAHDHSVKKASPASKKPKATPKAPPKPKTLLGWIPYGVNRVFTWFYELVTGFLKDLKALISGQPKEESHQHDHHHHDHDHAHDHPHPHKH
jgi:hypothetical protein